ncbi:MAG TPA: FUSC family protein [Actinospica sp.]|nr:FUSC family protein [Actinospica sp.]
MLHWLRQHDPSLAATRRAGRTALVMPALFAVCTQVVHSVPMATFASFGAFAMLLMVEYTGPTVQRLRAHLGLGLAWALLICVGTLVARVTWLAVLCTVAIGFTVLFSGVVSSVLASSATPLLLAFILPVTSPVPLSQLPPRLAGVGIATAAAMLAITFLWPRSSTDPLSAPAAKVCRAVAAQLLADASVMARDADAPNAKVCRQTANYAAEAEAELRRAFNATPYRPTGLSTGSRALVRLVDELTWLSAIMTESAQPSEKGPKCDREAHVARRAAAAVLNRAAELLEDPRTDPARLRAASAELREAMAAMQDGATVRLPVARPVDGSESDVREFLGVLDLSFRAQELGFATLQIAANVELAAEAEQRGWFAKLLGLEPGGAVRQPLRAAWERGRAHVEWHSVWLHNSLRGAVGLGIAVMVANMTSVQHSFWVLLGTLSVLRSNALNTGQNALRAVTGTVIGSILGAGLLALVGHHGNVLWFLLPVAILIAGIAPAAISFAAGQAAFTVTLVILFNIGQNPDWHIVLLRIQDIALGCGVSLGVALFFWPRGATAAMDKALSEAYADSARYLADAVGFALGRCTRHPAPPEAPVLAGRQAAAAARRLDDAFRSYLAERGSKPVPLADMTTLVTGVVGLRLAADAVLALWRQAENARDEPDRAQARVELLGAATQVSDWYAQLAESFARFQPAPAPLERNAEAEARLVESVRRDLADENGRATATAVRIIWTGDHLEAARRLQPSLAAVAPAGARF